MKTLDFESLTGSRAPRRRAPGFTLIEIMIVILIMSIVVAIAIPVWIRARSQSRMKICQENLSKIDGSKEQWAFEHHMLPGALPDESDLVQGPMTTGYLKFFPLEPSGGDYSIHIVGEDPTCDTGFPGHDLEAVGQTITELEF